MIGFVFPLFLGTASENPMLSHVMVKCTVQLELIQAVESIVFFPATSRKEDAEFLAIAEVSYTDSVVFEMVKAGFCFGRL